MRNKILIIPTTLFLLVRTFFKKTNYDNFIGGLIAGAIFSLLVNVMTVQLQERISKQKYLESLELEIASHYLLTNNIVSDISNSKKSQNKVLSMRDRIYLTRVWDSGLASAYFHSVNADTQAELISYYDAFISQINVLYARYAETVHQYENDFYTCVFQKKPNCEKEIEVLNMSIRFHEDQMLDMSKSIYNHNERILKVFYPTQDRLDNPFLRAIMGNDSVKILRRNL